MKLPISSKKIIPSGVVHNLPIDFKIALLANPKAMTVWQNITPLARNEWICWIVTVKQSKTRDQHIKRAILQLTDGKRRPCCWIGCVHRTDKLLSPSVKWLINKQAQ